MRCFVAIVALLPWLVVAGCGKSSPPPTAANRPAKASAAPNSVPQGSVASATPSSANLPPDEASPVTTSVASNSSKTAAEAPMPSAETPAAHNTEPSATADPPPPEPGQRLLLLAPAYPLVVEVHVTIDGRPLGKARERLVSELLRMADGDGDGEPTWEEAFADDQFAQLEANIGTDANDADRQRRRKGYDRNSNGKLDLAEAERFVEQVAGDGSTVGVQSGSMLDGSTDRSRLRELLDADGDRLLSAEEWRTAAERLKSYDIDDNELLSVVELSGMPLVEASEAMRSRAVSEGISPRALQLGPHANWASIMYSLEELYLVDGRLGRESFGPLGELFDHLDLDGDGRLTRTEIQRLNTGPTQLEIDVNFGRTGQLAKDPSVRRIAEAVSGPNGAQPDVGGFLALAGLKLQLATSDSTPESNFEMTAQVAITQIDKDRNGYFDEEEFKASDSPSRLPVEFTDVDLDDDGKVYASELEDYLARQQMPNVNRIQLVVTDLEDAFFWALDSSGDGRLSPRELQQAPMRLQQLDRDGDDQLTRSEIPPLVTLSIDRGDRNMPGTPRIARLAPPLATPAGQRWFKAMDRNGDGDISRGEFIGSRQQFERLDSNCDRFIDIDEAANASAGPD